MSLQVTLSCDDAEQGELSVEALRRERAGSDNQEGARTARATVGKWCGEECSDGPRACDNHISTEEVSRFRRGFLDVGLTRTF